MEVDTTRFLSQCLSYISSFALRCAVDLNISDVIHAHGGPMPLAELARSIPIPSEKELMLGQVMRLLAQQGVFAQSEAGYTLTPYSQLLLTKGDDMGAYVRFMTQPVLVTPWFLTSEWLKTSEPHPLYNVAHDGQSFWETAKKNPGIGQVFNEALATLSKKFTKELVTRHPQIFEGLKSLMDVGGGTGTTVKYIADAFPALQCTVFDLPHVIASTPKNEAFNAVGGDMFEMIPPTDAVFIKNVLHDWNEEDCVKILKRCREAIPEDGGKIIVVEMIVNLTGDENPEITQWTLLFDLFMMCKHKAQVCTWQEWKKIFHAAGFTNYKILPANLGWSVIELYP